MSMEDGETPAAMFERTMAPKEAKVIDEQTVRVRCQKELLVRYISNVETALEGSDYNGMQVCVDCPRHVRSLV